MTDKEKLKKALDILIWLKNNGQFLESTILLKWTDFSGEQIEEQIDECIELDNEFINVNYLKQLHSELTEEEIKELLSFCNENTIKYKECYGKGEIMFPLFMQHKNNKF